MTGEACSIGSSAPFTVSDARLATVLDMAADGIIVIDEQASVMIINKACERMFGYDAREVVGRNVSLLMPPEHQSRHGAYLRTYKRTGVPQIIGSGRDVQGRRKDGSLFPLDLSVGETMTPDGRQFICILRDLTAREEADRRLNELQADLIRLTRVSALDEMGLALAHELNQPLTAIMLYLQAAGRELAREREQTRNGTRAPAILDKALRETQRAKAIIQRLRKLAEKRAPERRSIDLNAIVEDAVDLSLVGHDRSVRMVRDYRRDLPAIQADQVQIQQVVLNLIRNAFEAVRDRRGAEIVVSTGLSDRHAVLSVADNGPGIPPDRLADLFQSFQTGKRNGMGLGLAISRMIVQSHGGELLVDPGGSGLGARFIVRLPLSGDHDEARAASVSGFEGEFS